MDPQRLINRLLAQNAQLTYDLTLRDVLIEQFDEQLAGLNARVAQLEGNAPAPDVEQGQVAFIGQAATVPVPRRPRSAS